MRFRRCAAVSAEARAFIERHRAALSARDARLLVRAVETLEANVLLPPDSADRLPWHPRRGICPSPFAYCGMWNWDSAFHAVGVALWDPEWARDQIRIFLNSQLSSGGLPDVIYESGEVVDAFGKPPVMPWATEVVDRYVPDDAFVAEAYPRWTAYERYWRRERGGDAEGLFYYDSATEDPGRRLTEAGYESGWDNSVRWDGGVSNLWPVDLNCYMVMVYRALAYLAGRLSRHEDRQRWSDAEQQLSDLIATRLYDEETGSYRDSDRAEMSFSRVLTPASFMPLYLGISSSEHAASMAEIAADPTKFFPGMPTVAYDDPNYQSDDYWRGPTWLNVAYFAYRGLRCYGFDETAGKIRETLLGWCDRNGDAIYEYYDSRTGEGLGARQFSWSAVFVIELILAGMPRTHRESRM